MYYAAALVLAGHVIRVHVGRVHGCRGRRHVIRLEALKLHGDLPHRLKCELEEDHEDERVGGGDDQLGGARGQGHQDTRGENKEEDENVGEN